MTIGLDASRANRPHKTGTEWYSFHLIKNLALLDKENEYRLYLDRPASAELIQAVRSNANFSLHFLRWPFPSFWTLGRLSLEMLFRCPDVLFVPAHGLPLIRPRRTVNTIHDLAFAREQSLYRPEAMKTRFTGTRPFLSFLVRLITFGRYRSSSLDYLLWSTAFALRHARKIIAVSNFTKQEIINIYPRADHRKIRVIYNGYNSELYRPVDDANKAKAARDKYGIETPYFLYLGRLEKKKNTLALVEALSILREERPQIKEKLVLIGDAGFGYDEIKYMIEEFNLNREVLMPGWADEEDLPYILNGATAFLFPSRHEGFGIPIIQAFACGVPTAVSDIPVLREIAGEAALYFDKDDKREIAKVMARLAEDGGLRQDLRAKGLRRAAEFSWEKCARQTWRELTEWS